MHDVALARIDLNLLPALDALLRERNVSHAADAVGLSQSAMSRALQRLRRLFEDQLLVRTGSEYQLTPRGERLSDELASLIPRLTALLGDESFSPSRTTRTFSVLGSDYAMSVVGTPLSRLLLADAPHSALRFIAWHPAAFGALDDPTVDLALFGSTPPPHLSSEQLFVDHFACVVAHDHPLARRRSITLADYLRYRHVVIDIEHGGQPAVDRVLAARGLTREAGIIVPFHAAAPFALPGTQLVLTMPARLLDPFVTRADDDAALRVLPAPSIVSTMRYSMTWHPRMDDDASHKWLRRQVRTAVTHGAASSASGPSIGSD